MVNKKGLLTNELIHLNLIYLITKTLCRHKKITMLKKGN